MKIFRYFIGIIALLCVVTVMGCSHSLEIQNLSSYRSLQINPLSKPVKIGIISNVEDPSARRLLKSVGSSLSKEATVFLPYSLTSPNKVDIVAKVNILPEYKGSGWNFLVNWPGFIIFAPALFGYGYKVDYMVDVFLTQASNNEKIDSFTIPISLDVRHAAINRTWTEISWLEVGAIALIGGLAFTQYDAKITPLVMEKIDIPIGDYIAQEIIGRINNMSKSSYFQGRFAAGRFAAAR